MDIGWVAADACTLPTVERPLRVAEFDALFAGHLVEVIDTGPARLRLVLRGPVGLAERVQDLADRETECCSFFRFSLSEVADRVPGEPSARTWLHLDVEVPAPRTAVLTAFAERAAAVSAGASATRSGTIDGSG